jgi:type IV pilus modification protein PilV
MLTLAPSRGFTLIEAMIAIAILVAGLAGSAALLLRTVGQERESANRRAAIRIAASMADQLRAMRRPDGQAVLAMTGIDPAAACADHQTSCAAERVAERLRAAWAAEAALALPEGAAAEISVPNPLVPEYLISIDWPAIGGGTERLELPVTT